jgi:thiol-disulfide isomerase/thioredoxin
MALDPKLVHAPRIGVEWHGRITLIDFWDYTCINCIRTLPYVTEWHRRYAGKGLAVIGVHAPEFAFARDRTNVDAVVREFGIGYPVLLDNDYRIWRAFANRYWPAAYLVDHDGYVRYRHYGEGAYGRTEEAIQELLRDLDPGVELPSPMEAVRALDLPGVLSVCERPTPELHLGAGASVPEGLSFDGEWWHETECAVVAGSPSRLRLRYSAAQVNLVMAPGAASAALEVLDNGAPVDHPSRGADVREAPDGRTVVGVDRARMYRLIRRDRFLSRTLELRSHSRGLELYAFTFVTCVPRP